jgi:hypothetical protein
VVGPAAAERVAVACVAAAVHQARYDGEQAHLQVLLPGAGLVAG